jgi:hypothetical protein
MVRAMIPAPVFAATLLVAAACSERVDGVQPVGGDTPSPAELERFARRLHLDLTASVPDDVYLGDAVVRLETEGNTAATRGALADALIEQRAFADAFVEELENRLFAGDSLDGRYDFVCGILRGADPVCMACGPAPDTNQCGSCDCPPLALLDTERTRLLASAADLHDGGATTSAIERAYAASLAFRFLFAPETLAAALFEQFLGRPPEADELDNATRIAQGSLLGPDAPAGLLFHRHGNGMEDLVDILFASEAYREAAVAAVFARYLGRPPTPPELGQFAAQLDPAGPDVRAVVRAVVSSREYYAQ